MPRDVGRVPSLCAFHAREAEPSGAAQSGPSCGPGRRFSFCEIGRGGRARSHGAWIAPGALPE